MEPERGLEPLNSSFADYDLNQFGHSGIGANSGYRSQFFGFSDQCDNLIHQVCMVLDFGFEPKVMDF